MLREGRSSRGGVTGHATRTPDEILRALQRFLSSHWFHSRNIWCFGVCEDAMLPPDYAVNAQLRFQFVRLCKHKIF